MGDVFKEQLVKKLPGKFDMMKKAGLIVGALIVSLALLTMPVLGIFAPIIVFVIVFGVYYLLSFFKIEYEYSFTNGSLDIDVIYNKSRRKRLFTGDVKDFEIMARTSNNEKSAEFKSAETVIDYSSGADDTRTYAFLTRYKGKRVKIIIEPNDMMLQAFGTALTPRKLIK
ncbi:MAG: DUF6106 family protein [Defluviitaleaceae bacterium]|nr:DUF6106 family protein [Defluviitaleaceae bacterium]